jgi:steroid 5-alpha reductase family enzyme
MGFPVGGFFVTLGWCALLVVAAMVVTFLVGRRIGRFSVVDSVWGGGFVIVAVTAFASSFAHGDLLRRILLLALVVVWGFRLAYHVTKRNLGKGEDPRYEELLSKHQEHRDAYAFVVIFMLQAVLVLWISLPLQVGMVERGSVGVLGWIGVVVWAVGLYFESQGDRQMSDFKADPENKGKLIDVGLWRVTRHPNYFGDACVWTGLFLLAAERWPGVLTILSLATMVYLLAFGSGKKVLERSMMKRDGYRMYARKVSGIIPLPRRKNVDENSPIRP